MMRNRWFIFGVVLVLAMTADWARRANQQSVLQHQQLSEWQTTQQQEAWLDKSVEIKLNDIVPLDKWLAKLARQAGVQYKLHISDEFKQEIPEIHLPLQKQSARDALQALALEVPIRWRPYQGELVVQLLADHEWPPVNVQVHLLRPSLSPRVQSQIAQAVERYIEPDAWEDVGGDGTLVQSPGQLTIVQHYNTQLRIGKFLEKLQTHLEQSVALPASGLAVDDSRLQPTILQSPYQRWTKATRALERKISLDVEDIPLKDVIEKLSEKLEISIVIPQNRMEDAGIQPDMPMTLRVENQRAAAVFEMLFHKHNLAIMPAHGNPDLLRVVLTEDKESLQNLTLVAYPLPDFVVEDQSLERVTEILQRVVDPANWQYVGGWGDVDRIGNSLLITQLPRNHAEIERSLQALRLVRSAHTKSLPLPLHTPERKRILEKLDEPLALKYENVQLQNVLADMERRTSLTFRLHKDSDIRDVSRESIVSCDFPARPLSLNLMHMLDAFGLSYRIHDDYVSVESFPEGFLLGQREFEVIDARPLLQRGICTFNEIRSLLIAAVEPDSWDDVGGNGSINELQGLLVVGHHSANLVRVREVYLELENDLLPGKPGRKNTNLIARPPADSEAPLIRMYAVDDLLQPRGKLSGDELISAINLSPVRISLRSAETFTPTLKVHGSRFLIATVRETQTEELETKLKQLRMRK